MTGLLHEKEFSRKAFIAGSGALVVGVASAGPALAASGNTPFSQRTSADYKPNLSSIDSWLAITPDNKVIITSGEPEFSGTPTSILMMAAEELDTNMSQMTYARPETWLNDNGGSAGSAGTVTNARPVRAMAAYARQILNGLASTKLGVPISALTVTGGVVSGGGKSVTYGQLIGGQNFNYVIPEATANFIPGGTANTPSALVAKPVANYSLVGRLVHKIDIPAKVAGTYTYIHNVRVPGMQHGRRIRPRGAGANSSQNAYPLSVDPTSIAHIPGSQVVQVANWLGVVAPKEYDAIQAAAQLKVVWKSDPKFGDGGSGNYWKWLRIAGDNNYHQTQAGATGSGTRTTADSPTPGAVVAALAGAAKTVSATYHYHYNNYVEIGPCCAVADIKKDATGAPIGGVVFATGQNINSQAPGVAAVLTSGPFAQYANSALERNIRAIHFEGSGSYGTGQNGQAVEEAALLSFMVGKPVRLQWMRWDQTGWDFYGPASMMDVTAGVDASGKIVGMDWTAYGQSQTNIDRARELLGQVSWAAAPATGPTVTPNDSGGANIYNGPGYPRRVLSKTQPLYQGALAGSFLRAPSAPQQYFATEQIADELAHAAGMDPVAFRRQNMAPAGTTVVGDRWLGVLDGATIAAGWKSKVAASNLQSGNIVTGRGFGFGSYASSQVAIVADITVNKKTGKMVANHLTIAQTNGITMNLEGVTTQMSGAVIQGLSRAMWEQPTWDKERVTSVDWVTYPILRIKDAPTVTLVNVHPGQYKVVTPADESLDVMKGNTAAFNSAWLATGSGEPPTAAIGSAMANAFFDATGVRIRQAPMRPEIVRATLKAAGVS